MMTPARLTNGIPLDDPGIDSELVGESRTAMVQEERMGLWSDLIHGTNEEGKEVTAKFGEGRNEGETLLADGHKSEAEFTGSRGNRSHDHYDGRGGGTEREQYTGEGS